jgi:transcriptional regulator with XRE-family HTH domain
MEMHITPGWLRNKIETTSEIECEAGIPAMLLENLGMFLPRELIEEFDEERIVRLKHAFGIFIRNLRLTNELTVDVLAEAAYIHKDELLLIESDPHHITKPRTVYQLANFFGIKVQKMMKISGASQTLDEELEEETLQFAAKSDGVSSLNKDEQQILNEYVKFLNKG